MSSKKIGRPAKLNRNKLIAVARYGLGMTLAETAEAFGISTSRVSTIELKRPEVRAMARRLLKEAR